MYTLFSMKFCSPCTLLGFLSQSYAESQNDYSRCQCSCFVPKGVNADVLSLTSICPPSAFLFLPLAPQVRVAEFNSEPVLCTVLGSGMPGEAKVRAAAQNAFKDSNA